MAACLEVPKSSKAKLSELSCPFTWELNEMATLYNNTRGFWDPSQDAVEDDIPILAFIFLLTKCYENVQTANTDNAKTKLDAAEKCLANLEQSGEFDNIMRTLNHIFYATKCYYLYEVYNEKELEDILKDIVNVSDFTNEEQSALEGCKSAAFLNYYDFGVEKAIIAANEAIKKDGNNALWHLILGKSLRRKRRTILVHSSPCNLEAKHFEKAFELSKNPVCGMYFAQMKRECTYKARTGNRKQMQIEQEKLDTLLLEIYKIILDSETKNYKLLLKTALGYLRIKISDETVQAEKCLNAVDQIVPNNPTSLHYRGLLHEARGEWREALKFFKDAGDLNNFVADINYAQCGWESKHVDPLQHLLGMKSKYSEAVKERQQELLIHIATCYYALQQDNENAMKYYLKAIDVDPDGPKLTCFYKFVGFVQKHGIYNFLHCDFIPRMLYLSKKGKFGATSVDVMNQLHERCKRYYDKMAMGLMGLMSNVKI